jgi:hypothetical protein
VRSALDIGLPDPVVALVLLLLPLVLHITTATLSALGARRGKWAYGIGIAAAIVVHAAYNLSILVIAGVV